MSIISANIFVPLRLCGDLHKKNINRRGAEGRRVDFFFFFFFELFIDFITCSVVLVRATN